VPGVLNVCRYDSPFWNAWEPVRSASKVTVCASASRLVHVTSTPGFTEMTCGEKEKLLIATLVATTGAANVEDAAGVGMAIGPGPDAWLTDAPPHAARVRVEAAATAASAAS